MRCLRDLVAVAVTVAVGFGVAVGVGVIDGKVSEPESEVEDSLTPSVAEEKPAPQLT